MTTKVHAVTDGLGNPLRFLLSSGNRNDICMAQALLEPFDLSGRLILADKGYDSDKFVHWIEERGGIVVIPSRICAKRPRNTDWHTYKERHLVENLFLKLKNYRRFATRYEKKALYFLSCGCLPCVYPCLVTLIVLKQTLGPTIETNFRKAMIMSDGDVTIFITRPICIILIVLTIVMLVGTTWMSHSMKEPAE